MNLIVNASKTNKIKKTSETSLIFLQHLKKIPLSTYYYQYIIKGCQISIDYRCKKIIKSMGKLNRYGKTSIYITTIEILKSFSLCHIVSREAYLKYAVERPIFPWVLFSLFFPNAIINGNNQHRKEQYSTCPEFKKTRRNPCPYPIQIYSLIY